ncbi:urea ABC transporter substrate-binding protein [Nakamurella deserti]|uniref:urea ABC transporter substrate-binding protein n=1 Tax=Nakamurella deserti TaxID=2164074 RepID=UPI0014796203|nr:urea ABC transporter substrate-binding protein [Nakamurella deserti]
MKHTRRNITSAGLLGLTAVLVLTACGSKITPQAGGSTTTSSSAGSATPAAAGASCVDTSGDSVKIGFLNSLSGTMAISEKTVQESLMMAADEINAAGGVLGKQLEVVAEDGASEPATFAEKATKLIQSDCVAAVFGGWTSSSRKAMLPVFESNDALLYYPVQYEGLESSKNIFYTGATTNQQILPALDYLKEQGVTSLFLVGSDYVFPQTANKEIKAWAAANGMEIKGEEYVPLASGADFSTIITKVKDSGAGAVFNTLNGDANVSFFKEYRNVGLAADTMPVVSVSIAEEEVSGVGVENLVGQLTAWNYYQTLDTPANKKFVEDFKAKYGDDRVTSDPMEAAYTSMYLWKNTVEKGKSFAVADIQANAGGVSFEAPEGTVTINGDNHHIAKTALIGKVAEDGLIYTEWTSPAPIEPDPYLTTYPWAAGLS